MGLFSKLFKKDISKKYSNENIVRSDECVKLLDVSKRLDDLLDSNEYIAKSDYRYIISFAQENINYFKVLDKSKMLENYCKDNSMDYEEVKGILEKVESFETLADLHNDEFLKNSMETEKEYLDNILKDVDPVIKLDDDQRRVVLTDEDYCLVVAGAGAGKTTTVAAKVKYLVDKKGIDPSQILVVSFTNKAVQELRDKLNKDLNINCIVSTFHSTGNAILRKHSPERLNIVDDSKLYFVIQDYFKSAILKNESLVNNLILFFASYFDAPYEGTDLNLFFNKLCYLT